MRDIKFRAFKKKTPSRGMYKVEGIDFKKKSVQLRHEFHSAFWVPFRGIELMEYTGLHAKNGEIYEGDIVRMLSRNLSQVYFRDSGFCVDVGGLVIGFHPDYLGRYRTVEVVGNIYENPELLKGA